MLLYFFVDVKCTPIYKNNSNALGSLVTAYHQPQALWTSVKSYKLLLDSVSWTWHSGEALSLATRYDPILYILHSYLLLFWSILKLITFLQHGTFAFVSLFLMNMKYHWYKFILHRLWTSHSNLRVTEWNKICLKKVGLCNCV